MVYEVVAGLVGLVAGDSQPRKNARRRLQVPRKGIVVSIQKGIHLSNLSPHGVSANLHVQKKEGQHNFPPLQGEGEGRDGVDFQSGSRKGQA